jgi:hypothetical protein
VLIKGDTDEHSIEWFEVPIDTLGSFYRFGLLGGIMHEPGSRCPGRADSTYE